MSLEENKALVRRFNHEAFDEGDLGAAERYLAPDFLNHVSGKRGIEDMQRIIKYVRAAFPDGRQRVDQEVAEGDLVVQLITSTGTHTGENPSRALGRSDRADWQSGLLAERANLPSRRRQDRRALGCPGRLAHAHAARRRS